MQRWSWCLGMVILAGVPAIVGGGLFWHFLTKWTPVIIWELILLLLLIFAMVKGSKQEGRHGV